MLNPVSIQFYNISIKYKMFTDTDAGCSNWLYSFIQCLFTIWLTIISVCFFSEPHSQYLCRLCYCGQRDMC